MNHRPGALQQQMMVLIIKDGKTLHTSKNLRGVSDHARRAKGETLLQQTGDKDRRTLSVRFADGAHCDVRFESAVVLADWIADRVRYGRGRYAIKTTQP